MITEIESSLNSMISLWERNYLKAKNQSQKDWIKTQIEIKYERKIKKIKMGSI